MEFIDDMKFETVILFIYYELQMEKTKLCWCCCVRIVSYICMRHIMINYIITLDRKIYTCILWIQRVSC